MRAHHSAFHHQASDYVCSNCPCHRVHDAYHHDHQSFSCSFIAFFDHRDDRQISFITLFNHINRPVSSLVGRSNRCNAIILPMEAGIEPVDTYTYMDNS